MMELSVPIRVYWDLPAPPAAPSFDHLALCDELVALQVLALNLWQPGAEVSAATIQVVERLAKERIAVNLTLSGDTVARSLETVSRLKVKSLLLDVSGIEELCSLDRSVLDAGMPTGVSLPLHAGNCREIPEIIRFCLQHGIGELSFPIARAVAGRGVFFLNPAERRFLADALREMELDRGLRLTIHDPFLWKIFYPDKAFPEGGCQAANSMLFVTPEGEVCPCPALPYALGNLGDTTFSAIAKSPQKREVRKALRRFPEECLECAALPTCFGGCRGRGYAAALTFDAADPGCG
ncbi:SPASM domain-containing protein [Geomonas sp. RF6]|uniref:SPASM domain-containing protein n=1 Tax=Geomonas sp. RF6 TaxID=2897342 RepID=UPI001E3806DC|nr:SPASM domain-containing protein [Geomonas sp. RF6]UFS70312.1 SPASM domain-containing protein [Geomonas sp. RF6]